MSSDEEGELCRFGTPLDPIEEDEIPTTKKITLADQIATDSNGKRRFHGAFTGGFSAGFWNTVGSREGWTPSEFKSSRGEKATHRVQKASDFMDDEDIGEFGIAPQRIQTTEDFGPSESRERNKRKLQSTTRQQGPIPGVPVLELVLESCHDKAAVRLLKQMDKKYALNQKSKKSPPPTILEPDDEPMDTSQQDESESVEQGKVYKCDMGPMRHPRSDTDDSDDDEQLVFDKDELDSMFEQFKTNRFGLGYKGLDKGNFFTTVGAEAPVVRSNYDSLSTFTMLDQNKKKVTIRGQAFGVGAFEEDDDDIYGRDDMGKYDFRLDSQVEKSSSKSSRSNERGFLSGFCDASSATRIAKKHVFKVSLPFSFEPRNWLKRKSRFGPEVVASTSTVKGPADKVIGRHDLTPDQRGQLLGNKITKNDAVNDIDAKLIAAGLKPMSFTTGGVENKTEPTTTNNDLSSKIDENLTKIRQKNFIVPEGIPQIFDRFTSSSDSKPLSELDSNEANVVKETPPIVPDPPKEVKKIIRTKNVWVPCQLLCYKMNMETNVGSKPEKGNAFSLFQCIANPESLRRRKELEFTNVQPDDSEYSELKKIEERSKERANQAKSVPNASTSEQTEVAASHEVAALNSKIETKAEMPIVKRTIKPKSELEMKILSTQDEHPSKKKDIFKAIFDSDSESDETHEDDDGASNVSKVTINADVMSTLTKQSSSMPALYTPLPDIAFKPKSAREVNILRNTSPPRGIFSGLSMKSQPIAETKTSQSTEKTCCDETSDAYGPSLPPTKLSHSIENKTDIPTNQGELNSTNAISLGKTKVIYEEKWIEKSDDREKKSKKSKKHKKDIKHKSKKEKKEKHKKKKR